jgi:hypothetical protein
MRPRPLASAAQRLQKPPGRPRKPVLPPPPALPLPPARVFTQRQAAAYLAIGERSLRDLESRQIIARVRLLIGPHERRRALYDREDLDALIERRKARREQEGGETSSAG